MLRSARSLTFACCLAVASPALALRAYYIGNSLTDVLNYDAFKTSVLTLDKSYVWGRHVIPGAPLDWNWSYPNDCIPGDVGGCYQDALGNFIWDVVTLQPYDRGISGSGDACCDNDSNYAAKYMDYAKGRSPNAQFFIYAQWPKLSNDYDAAWLKPYPNGPRIKVYYEKLTQACQKTNNGMKKILMIPAGHVLYELNQRMKAGQVSGETNINGFYSDDTHLNSKGSYVVACAFFGCMYRQNPNKLPYASYGISGSLAAAIQAAAWKVLTSNPLTGVTGTAVAQTVRGRGVSGPIALATWRRFTVSGRLLDKSQPGAAAPRVTAAGLSTTPESSHQ